VAGRTFSICLGLVLLTFALFFRVIYFPFITYDDQLYVADNAHVLTGLHWSNIAWAFTTWHTGNWHPLTWLSLMLDAQLFGRNAGGYHFTNVLLHLVNSVLLFLVLRLLTRFDCSRRPVGDARASHRDAATDVWRSALVAALFAVHPLPVESVAWVSERKDVQSALF
jgi:hypothetical protein